MKKILLFLALISTFFISGCKENALEPVVSDDIAGGTLEITVTDARLLPVTVKGAPSSEAEYKILGEVTEMNKPVKFYLMPASYDFKFSTGGEGSFDGREKSLTDDELRAKQTLSKKLGITDFPGETGVLVVNIDNADKSKLLPMKVHKYDIDTSKYEEIMTIGVNESIKKKGMLKGAHKLKFEVLQGNKENPLGMEYEVDAHTIIADQDNPVSVGINNFDSGTLDLTATDARLLPITVYGKLSSDADYKEFGQVAELNQSVKFYLTPASYDFKFITGGVGSFYGREKIITTKTIRDKQTLTETLETTDFPGETGVLVVNIDNADKSKLLPMKVHKFDIVTSKYEEIMTIGVNETTKSIELSKGTHKLKFEVLLGNVLYPLGLEYVIENQEIVGDQDNPISVGINNFDSGTLELTATDARFLPITVSGKLSSDADYSVFGQVTELNQSVKFYLTPTLYDFKFITGGDGSFDGIIKIMGDEEIYKGRVVTEKLDATYLTGILSLEEALALYEGQTDVLSIGLLLNSGINASSSAGYTALILASEHGYIELVKSLIFENANVNIENVSGNTALIEASLSGHTDVVKELIAAGADLDIKDDYGRTALSWATRQGYTDIVNLLKAAGARL